MIGGSSIIVSIIFVTYGLFRVSIIANYLEKIKVPDKIVLNPTLNTPNEENSFNESNSPNFQLLKIKEKIKNENKKSINSIPMDLT